jgi:hypothetical protein
VSSVSDLLREKERLMEGLKAALETTKQVIALSTGVITLTVTFLEKIIQPQSGAARHVPSTLKIGWICFGLATACALWTLMAITGTMNALDREARKLSLNTSQQAATQNLVDGTNIRVPAVVMLLLFAVGIGLMILSGFYL